MLVNDRQSGYFEHLDDTRPSLMTCNPRMKVKLRRKEKKGGNRPRSPYLYPSGTRHPLTVVTRLQGFAPSMLFWGKIYPGRR